MKSSRHQRLSERISAAGNGAGGFNGAVGGDWGQRLAPGNVMNNLAAASQLIVVHEMGHGLGFPDYYNWDAWAPGVAPPPTIMVVQARCSADSKSGPPRRLAAASSSDAGGAHFALGAP
jgi:hypothetical protein